MVWENVRSSVPSVLMVRLRYANHKIYVFLSPMVEYKKLRKSFIMQMSMDIADTAVLMLTDNSV